MKVTWGKLGSNRAQLSVSGIEVEVSNPTKAVADALSAAHFSAEVLPLPEVERIVGASIIEGHVPAVLREWAHQQRVIVSGLAIMSPRNDQLIYAATLRPVAREP
jgi:hypothetical protein